MIIGGEEMTSLALNPFEKGRKPENIDEIILDSNLREPYHQYMTLLNEYDFWYDLWKPKVRSKIDVPLLTPGEISMFLRAVLDMESSPLSWYEGSALLGVYVTRLIEASFKAGNNDFVLYVEKSVDSLCSYLQADFPNYINLEIRGDVGEDFAENARNIKVKIIGSAGGNCGLSAQCSIITITGDAGDSLGGKSFKSRFYVKGTTGNKAGESATESTFYLKDVGDNCGMLSKGCKIHVHNATKNLGRQSVNGCFRVFGKKGIYCGYKSDSKFFDKEDRELKKRKMRRPKVNYDPMARYSR